MKQINWKQIWMGIRTYVLNKYVLTLLIFAVIFLFVGEQSLVNDIKRGHQIRQTQQEIEASEQAIINAHNKLNSLQQIDSLEKYAREKYLMHKDNEDIFLIEE